MDSIADNVVEFLNNLVALDLKAVQSLLEFRVPCNEDLGNHPTVQVLPCGEDSHLVVGILGIINGMVGTDSNGRGMVAARYEESGTFTGFVRATYSDETAPGIVPDIQG